MINVIPINISHMYDTNTVMIYDIPEKKTTK